MSRGILLQPLLFSLVCQESFCLAPSNITVVELQLAKNMAAMVFIAVILFSSNIINYFLLYFKASIPLGSIIITIGMIWGIIAHHNRAVLNLTMYSETPANHFLEIYLPIIIFEIAYAMNYNMFFKSLGEILIISTLVYHCSLLFVGFLITLVFQSDWSSEEVILFGTLCLPSNPKHIVQILQDIGAHTKHTRILLNGESMITLALCSIIYVMLTYPDHPSDNYTGSVIDMVIGTTIIKPLIGVLMGFLGVVLLKLCQTDVVNAVFICLSMPLLCYSVISHYQTAGALTSLAMGVVMGMNRKSLPPKQEKSLLTILELISHSMNNIVYARAGITFGLQIVPHMLYTDPIWIFVTYIMVNIGRLISFSLFLPILSRIGHGLSFQNMLILVWSGQKNPIILCMTMALEVTDRIDPNTTNVFLKHIVGLFIIDLFLNGTTTPFLLNLMGISKIPQSKQINMNNCMKIVLERRNRAISVLKMDKILSDANWLVVNTATEMRHPYMLDLQKTKEFEISLGSKFTHCPDCKKDIPEEPTPKEFQEMMKEAQLRCLRANKIAYTRQFESGLLSKRALKVLLQSADVSMNSEDATMDIADILAFFETEQHLDDLLKKHSMGHDDIILPRPPPHPCRRICHKIISSNYFAIFMYIVIVIDFMKSIIGLTLLTRKNEKLIFCFVNTSFCLIYIIEMIIYICAYSRASVMEGLKIYFRSFWHIIDFVVLCGNIIDIALDIIDSFTRLDAYYNFLLHVLVKVSRILRLLKLFRYCRPCSQKMVTHISKKININAAFAYEIGQGYVKGQNEALEILSYMIDNKKIREAMKGTLENNKLEIMRLMCLAKKGKPWIAATVKTKQVIKTVLNNMMDTIQDLKLSGWIDAVESTKLMASLDERYKFVEQLSYVPSVRPKEMLREISWIGNEGPVIDYLYSNIVTINYEPGDVICKEADILDGIYIVMSGFLLQTYIPHPDRLRELKEYGTLPIVDYPSFGKYDEAFSDFIIQGNTFGELSTLTERPYCCQITADTHSLLYVLPRKFVLDAIDMSTDPLHGLESRIWKSLGIRLAIPMLLSVPAYQTTDALNIIKKSLERSFMPDLSNFKTFVAHNKMEDLLLIEGTAVDFNTRKVYTAPCYIPRTVLKLVLPHDQANFTNDTETKLLAIPTKDADDYEIMIQVERDCDLVDNHPTKSIRYNIEHIQGQLKKRRKKSMISFGQYTNKTPHTNMSLPSGLAFMSVQSVGDLVPVTRKQVRRMSLKQNK